MGLVSTPVIDGLARPRRARAVWAGGRDAGRLRPAGDTCSGARSRSCPGALGSGAFRRVGAHPEVAEDVLETVVAQHRALEPSGADVDAEQVEQVIGAERGDVVERLALDLIRKEARAGLADRAAAAGEADPIYDAVLHAEHQRDPIAAQRVRALVTGVGILDHPEVMRLPVVLKDVIAIQVVHGSLECTADGQSRPARSGLRSRPI